MCGLAGVIFGKKRRRAEEREHLAWLFTTCCCWARSAGHATGAAWLDVDGGPPALQRRVTARAVRHGQVLRRTPCLHGQPRRAPARAHPLAHPRGRTGQQQQSRSAREVIGTHNGTIYNADHLFRRWKMRRFAEVDSEILFRGLNAARDGAMDIGGLAAPPAPAAGR